MAFWGTEVKPGKPYTHLPENNTGRGRLHISQATLGSGNGEKKSVVQCNVGDKAPVLLCSLFPVQSESCQLNLEFDELHEVVFSVIGPHSVHLTGYYLPRSSHHFQNDESESYGEDIANTETERSDDDDDVGTEEDKYEDSFIDDGDTEVAPHSPIFSDEVSEEISHKRKPKNEKVSHRRLRKKYQPTLSEEDLSSQQNGATGILISDGENEDMIPISSLCKSSASSISRAEKKASKETGETIHKELQDVTEREADGVVDGVSKSQPDKPKKKSKKQYKEEEQVKPETGDDFFFGTILKWDQAKESETKADQSNPDMTLIDDDNKKTENKIQPVHHESILPSTEVGPGNGSKPKKKRKKRSKVEEPVKAGSEYNFFFSAFVEPDKAKENETKPEETSRDMTVINEDTNNYKTENTNQSDQHASIPSSAQLDTDNGVKPKKKKKKQTYVEEQFEAKSDGDFFSSTGEKTEQRETKADQSNQNMTVMGNENDNQTDQQASVVPSTQAGLENGVKPKRKKKKQSKVDEQVNGENEDVKQSKTKADQSNQDMTLIDEDNKRTENNNHLSGLPSAEVGSENVVKPKKKRKKLSKVQELVKAVCEDDHFFSTKADQTD